MGFFKLSVKSKNWDKWASLFEADSKDNAIYSHREFKRKDGGVTIQYYLLQGGNFISERFEKGEEAKVRNYPKLNEVSK